VEAVRLSQGADSASDLVLIAEVRIRGLDFLRDDVGEVRRLLASCCALAKVSVTRSAICAIDTRLPPRPSIKTMRIRADRQNLTNRWNLR
jgi:hypothetical protein